MYPGSTYKVHQDSVDRLAFFLHRIDGEKPVPMPQHNLRWPSSSFGEVIFLGIGISMRYFSNMAPTASIALHRTISELRNGLDRIPVFTGLKLEIAKYM